MSDQAVVDMFDRNDSTRVKLRLAARRQGRRQGRREEGARGSGRPMAPGGNTAPRSLPSGPALNPTGFAMALLILGFVAFLLGAGALAWIGWAAIDGLKGLFEEKESHG